MSGPSYAGNLTGSAQTSYAHSISGGLLGSYQGGPLVPFTPPNQGAHMTLYLHPSTCTYLYWLGVQATVTWNDSSQTTASAGTVVGGEPRCQTTTQS